MSEIKTIKADALKDMKGKEGLILQGCGVKTAQKGGTEQGGKGDGGSRICRQRLP